MKRLLVTGPVVVLPDATTGKTAYYYEGAVLPDGLDKDRVQGVIADGLVEEVDVDPPAPEEESTPDPDAVPDGTAEEVLSWVGDDSERAKRALEVEQAGQKRKTLIDRLNKLAETK